jgi:hypothetical protein
MFARWFLFERGRIWALWVEDMRIVFLSDYETLVFDAELHGIGVVGHRMQHQESERCRINNVSPSTIWRSKSEA